MRPARRLRILHLSDLHIGQERGAGQWRLRDVLGAAWQRNLDAIKNKGQIDLVCFTGDLAYSGEAGQYAEVGVFIDELLARLNLTKSRFFCVPGNHDIDQKIAVDAWQNLRAAHDVDLPRFDAWIAGERSPRGCEDAWRDDALQRQRTYREWLTDFGLDHLRPEHHRHGRLGYCVALDRDEFDLPAPLHIIGFDSAWLSGKGSDNGELRLTSEQIGRLLTDAHGQPLPGHAIGLIHHPFSSLVEVEQNAAPHLMSRKGLGLLLHGHLHDPQLLRWSNPQQGLHLSSAGCLYQHNSFPNSMHIIDVALPNDGPLLPVQLWVRSWSVKGYWHDDNSLYEGMQDGRLRLSPEPPEPLRLTPGHFIGRNNELDALRKALLPDDSAARKPSVVEGMSGVGKTRLAEELVQRYWLPALTLPADADPAAHVLRVALAHDDRRSALDLGNTLADLLRSRGPIDSLWRRLRPQLLEGPYRKPRLVLIENVDDPLQAKAVAELVGHLPDCAILVTARHRQIGGAGWARVVLAPMPLAEAAELLCSEAAAAGEGAYVPDQAEAEALANTLGHLPLALHIAASHLGLGRTPNSFLYALRENGLHLRPANEGDHSLSVDEARAMLRSSFDLSWKAWCKGTGVDPMWQQALVALAHGPVAGVGDSLGAAITALDEKQYADWVVAAKRFSLLEFQFEGEGVARRRNTNLHPLMAEFLRGESSEQGGEVVERIGGWLKPRLWLREDDPIDVAWNEIRSESDALIYWLGKSQAPLSWEIIPRSTFFARSFGPYSAWIRCYSRWLSVSENDEFEAANLVAIANISSLSGAYQKSVDAATRAANIFNRHGKKYEFAIAIGIISEVMDIVGKIEKSLDLCLKLQIPIFENLNEERERSAALHRVAGLYLQLGFSAQAMKICRRDLIPAFSRLNQRRYLALSFQLLAEILFRRRRENEAIALIEKEVIPLFKEVNDARELAVANDLLADILQFIGEYDRSIEIRMRDAIDVFQRIGDLHSLTTCRSHLAVGLLKRGRHSDRDYARRLLVQALNDAEAMDLPEASKIRSLIASAFSP